MSAGILQRQFADLKAKYPDVQWMRLRAEHNARNHAIYTVTPTGFVVTYCGRAQQGDQPIDWPERRCNCCFSRVQRPYLIPDELRQLKARNDECLQQQGIPA